LLFDQYALFAILKPKNQYAPSAILKPKNRKTEKPDIGACIGLMSE
jgi:hypothetical protein